MKRDREWLVLWAAVGVMVAFGLACIAAVVSA